MGKKNYKLYACSMLMLNVCYMERDGGMYVWCFLYEYVGVCALRGRVCDMWIYPLCKVCVRACTHIHTHTVCFVFLFGSHT